MSPPDAPPPSVGYRGRGKTSAGGLDNAKATGLVIERATVARARCETLAGLLARGALGLAALDEQVVAALAGLADAVNADLDRVLRELGAEVASP